MDQQEDYVEDVAPDAFRAAAEEEVQAPFQLISQLSVRKALHSLRLHSIYL